MTSTPRILRKTANNGVKKDCNLAPVMRDVRPQERNMETAWKSISKLAVEKFSESVLGYYHLSSYANLTLTRILSGHRTHEVTSCRAFYDSLRAGRIKHQDRIILKEFFAMEWIPRAAGGLAYLVHCAKLSPGEYELLPEMYSAEASLLFARGIWCHPSGL